MLTIKDSRFMDKAGRTVMLRGVNLGGSSKIPTEPDGATHRKEHFDNHREVSFVGRPFPLEEADEHYSRLRHWGFNLLRFVVTWEAIEHDGPGMYDESYLDYLGAVIRKAAEYDLMVWIDPHQDVWSRFCGGDGAPGWTLEMAGLKLGAIQETGAAAVQQWADEKYPHSLWFTNGLKLAAATMFTLFFAGDTFAPQTRFAGESAQEFLQHHYIAAFQQAAERLKGFDHVLGFGSMNEPLPGYTGWPDLRRPSDYYANGNNPSPYQSMLLGSGFPQNVEYWRITMLGPRRTGTRHLNPAGVCAWQKPGGGIWQQHGVWDVDASGNPHLLRPDYFYTSNGSEVDFNQDFLRPFVNRFAAGIRGVDPGALIFMETTPEHLPPSWGAEDADNMVYAPHWYDPVALTLKRNLPLLGYDTARRRILVGRQRIRQRYAALLKSRKEAARTRLNGAPAIIGEIGISYDMNGGTAYRTGNFTPQIQAMDRSMKALEDNLLHAALWNYTADNNNRHGDLWNSEDLSIFSRDQQDDPQDLNSGGRALEAVLRPYPVATAGMPLELSFDYHNRTARFVFKHGTGSCGETILYIPGFHYPEGVTVTVSDGEFNLDPDKQRLLYRHTEQMAVHTLEIRPAGS